MRALVQRRGEARNFTAAAVSHCRNTSAGIPPLSYASGCSSGLLAQRPYGTIVSTFWVVVTQGVFDSQRGCGFFPKRRTMKKLNKVAMMFAAAALATAAGAQTPVV